MKLIACDLEMNQPSGKIIQIGAVCFQPQDGLLVDTFNQFVNPAEALHPEIIELTRITDEALVGKPNIVESAIKFSEFKKLHQANSIGVVWGGAKTNDIRRVFDDSNMENPFKDRIIDVKATFQMLANASTSEMRKKAGLEKACELVGIGWSHKHGNPHNALADAYNTMRMYMFLSRCLVGGFNLKKSFD